MSDLLQGVPVLLPSGRPGDIVKVDALGILPGPLLPVPSVKIDRVEYCFDTTGRLTDVIYRLESGRCNWEFVEIGFSSVNPGVIIETRIMRKVLVAPDQPTEADEYGNRVIEYGGGTYFARDEDQGASTVLLLTAEDGLRRVITMRWIAYKRYSTHHTKQLVYAEWEGGSGVYWGFVFPPSSVSILMKLVEPEEGGQR